MQDSHQRIYAAIAAIPPGRVASYGAIAQRERVGTVDRSGQIALTPGSAGFRTQCRLLRAEGVEVKNGHVALWRFGLDADIDRILWGMPEP